MRDGAGADFGAALLGWYDRQARVLLWRVGPAARKAGLRPDPYRVWLSEVMLQQTTVAAVQGHFARFIAAWPSVEALAAAPEAEVMAAWAGLGYYARARNLLVCAREVTTQHRGSFPATAAALRALPGVGPYTAAAIAAIAFDEPATVVDANVERVVARLFAVQTPMPAAKRQLVQLAAGLTPANRPGDHAQAMMDLGATCCTPRAPACADCPVSSHCAARAAGLQEVLPRRAAKAAKPQRRGFAYVARRLDGAWLLEVRPPRGLLGGMLGWPGSAWGEDPVPAPPIAAKWREVPGEVRHTFTHFLLSLRVLVAEPPETTEPPAGSAFTSAASFNPAALPTLMRKILQIAQTGLSKR
ncbi:A/G-specific adenine glycosylase [Phaeovulum sp.]|uniref:A/G-specific adenine glycosylase n=1 Tax=Phaeovulum sp. TaxID=2934796 RepID=UPI00272F3BEC|nr:A/G-specific adenine glycosylase [Phaeovulum sp.]MDP1669235.1 A/G-specific adenine glycosylase [Phaeovulum sp.]MDZ4119534.1 A/G-specific adenine glycosylase [Phaeovulum sp.]